MEDSGVMNDNSISWLLTFSSAFHNCVVSWIEENTNKETSPVTKLSLSSSSSSSSTSLLDQDVPIRPTTNHLFPSYQVEKLFKVSHGNSSLIYIHKLSNQLYIGLAKYFGRRSVHSWGLSEKVGHPTHVHTYLNERNLVFWWWWL